MALVKARNITKTQGTSEIIRDATLQVNAGEITGLVGPDGAGKSTLLRIFAGLFAFESGALEIFGLSMPEHKDDVLQELGYMPQRFGLYEDLTVEENLRLYARLQSIPKANINARIDELLAFTNLSAFGNFLAKNLSGGMKQKLGLACALIKKPKLLLLDEPGVGVDPISRRELWAMVHKLLDEEIGVVWSTAYLEEASLCDRVILLNRGEILFNDKPEYLSKTMEGKVFQIAGNIPDKRETLRKALGFESVKDAQIRGESIKLICDDASSLPPLDTIHASGCRYEALSPEFEDGFLHLLNVNFDGVSLLARQMQPIPAINGCLIESKNLTKRFGAFTAAENISFQVKRGEIFGLLGPNGAGKSTTFKMLCGLLDPTGGEARVMGNNMRKSSFASRAKIGYMSQKFSLYGDISVIENLRFFAGIYGLKGAFKEQKVQAMVDIFTLQAYLSLPAKELPLGYKQRLALACAVMHDPVVLFLDEPTSGVDPATRREFWNHIYAMVQKGMSILVTTHFMPEAEYCDRIALIYKGRAIALDTPHNLIEEVAPGATMEEAFIALIQRSEHARR